MFTQSQLDKIANLYNKTKEPRYKEVRKNYGSNNIKRWTVSIGKCYKTNDGRN